MIKVSVFYPNGEGNTFDMAYYCDKHIPMVKQLLGAACTNVGVEQGVAGGAPGELPTYLAMGHLYFDNVEDFITSFTPHAAAITADIANYTNTMPTVQISEIRI